MRDISGILVRSCHFNLPSRLQRSGVRVVKRTSWSLEEVVEILVVMRAKILGSIIDLVKSCYPKQNGYKNSCVLRA
jgi:hypothetical protein